MSEREELVRRFHAERPGATAKAFARTASYSRLAATIAGAERVLDLACGDGPLLAMLGPRAIGLDLSMEELAANPSSRVRELAAATSSRVQDLAAANRTSRVRELAAATSSRVQDLAAANRTSRVRELAAATSSRVQDLAAANRTSRVRELAAATSSRVQDLAAANRTSRVEEIVASRSSRAQDLAASNPLRVQGRAQALPFRDGAFDACACHLAFMLFDDIERVVAELHRVIAPGGVFAALLGGGPVEPMGADGDAVRERDAFHRFLAIAGLRPIRLGDPRAKSEVGWRTLFAGWGAITFERIELELGGTFDDAWTFLGASYGLVDGDAVRAQLHAELGDEVGCRVACWLATARR